MEETQDDDEIMTFNDDSTEFHTFVKDIIANSIAKELKIPEEDQLLDEHHT